MANRRSILPLLAILLLGGIGQASITFAQPESTNEELRKLSGNQVMAHVGQKTYTITLYDNSTARDFFAKLPMKLSAGNYPGYDEKVIRLPLSLSMEGAPTGDNPEIPEVGYYQPGRWIAFYYGHIGYWSGKAPLGRIDASVEELRAIPEGTPVTFERRGSQASQ